MPAREGKTNNQKPDGEVGTRVLYFVPGGSETPPSPDGKRILTTWTPRVVYALHNVLNKGLSVSGGLRTRFLHVRHNINVSDDICRGNVATKTVVSFKPRYSLVRKQP